MKTLWYQLDEKGETAAMLVPGGMIVRTQVVEESGNGIACGEALCFVPSNDGQSVTQAKLLEWIESYNEDR